MLNALNMVTMQEFKDAFAAIKDDREVRVVILTGAGEKAFVAGADIGELSQQTPVSAKEYTHRGQANPRLSGEAPGAVQGKVDPVLQTRSVLSRTASPASGRSCAPKQDRPLARPVSAAKARNIFWQLGRWPKGHLYP